MRLTFHITKLTAAVLFKFICAISVSRIAIFSINKVFFPRKKFAPFPQIDKNLACADG